MRKLNAILLTMMLMLCINGCGGSEHITGKWVCSSDDVSETIELFSDGSGTLTQDSISYEITWVAEDGRLKISASLGLLGEYSKTVDYELNKEVLILSDENETLTYERK